MPLMPLDSFADPFAERLPQLSRQAQRLLGARVVFESNDRRLLNLADAAYAGLPAHRLATGVPTLRIRLLLTSRQRRRRGEPSALALVSGNGWLGGASEAANFVVMSPAERSALVVVTPDMLRFPYHVRYELIEFALYTLAARVQGLIPLHAACVGTEGRGVVLMGSSGAGKSTLALHSVLRGLDFLSEDSVFVHPQTLLATGIANYLHVRGNSLRWLERATDVELIRGSPVIRRRSGVAKFEVNLRRGAGRMLRPHLAQRAPQIVAIVFLLPEPAGRSPPLRPISKRDVASRMIRDQGYAAGQPQWPRFKKALTRIQGYELRRGGHPSDSVDAIRRVLGMQP